MTDESFVERILYRLVRRHISGPTMSSAISKAKELNDRKMPVSITFLSNNISNKAKARYVTTTYIELVRQLSRLGLKASIQIPLEQIGISLDENTASENLKNILESANKYGVFVWAELNGTKNNMMYDFGEARGLGFALGVEQAKEYLKRGKGAKPMKLMFNEYEGVRPDRKKQNGSLLKDIDHISKRCGNTVLFSTPEDSLWELLKNSKLSKELVYEFRFGYSSKKIKKAQKRGAKVSIYMPFGKEWETYAMNNVPHGYMRFLATKLLNENNKAGSI